MKTHTLAIILGKSSLLSESKENTIQEQLRIVSANSLFLAVKFSTLHYLVQGTTFDDIHNITENYYDHFFRSYDFYNERLVQSGNTPIRTINEAVKFTTFDSSELKTEYSTVEALNEILQLLTKHRKFIHNMKKVAAESEDYVTEDRTIDELRWVDKQIWTVKSRLSINSVS